MKTYKQYINEAATSLDKVQKVLSNAKVRFSVDSSSETIQAQFGSNKYTISAGSSSGEIAIIDTYDSVVWEGKPSKFAGVIKVLTNKAKKVTFNKHDEDTGDGMATYSTSNGDTIKYPRNKKSEFEKYISSLNLKPTSAGWEFSIPADKLKELLKKYKA